MEEYDVVIVGGGPARLSAAEVIARNGYRVVVLEAHGPNYEKPCAGMVSKETLHKFQISRAVVQFSTDNIWIFRNWKREKRIHYPLYIISRRKLNLFLAERARKSGAVIKYNQKVVEFEKKKGRIVAAITEKSKKYNGSLFILACGMDNCLRKAGFKIPTLATPFQYWIRTNKKIEEVQLHVGKEIVENGYGWVVPRGNKKAVVGLGSITKKHLKSDLVNFFSTLRKIDLIDRKSKIIRMEAAVTPIMGSGPYYKQNVFLCGSAGGVITPIYCAGISNALRTGVKCGETIVKLLEGKGNPDSYQSYVEKIPSLSFAKALYQHRSNKFSKLLLLVKYLPFIHKIYPRYTLCRELLKGMGAYSL